MELRINPDFEKLIPPLSPDEFSQLEANILAEGVRDPLVIAIYPDDNGEELSFLADGHNRYRIAQKHGLNFRTDRRTFTGEDDVVIWMIDNQKGRRNLTDFVKLELAEVKAERLAKKGRDNMSKGGSVTKQLQGLSIIDKPSVTTPHNTQKEIAADLGWSTGKVAMGQKVMKEAPEEVKQQVRAGEMSINQAYQEVRKIENEANRARVREELQAIDLKPTEKKYSVIYADPPWMYDGGKPLSDKYGDVQKHYPPMETADICALPVKDLAAQDCVIFLWATAPKLPEALEVMRAWGFQYKTCIVWDKVKHNFGFYFSVRHELLLIGGIGRSTPTASSELHDSVISIERSDKHSEKPEYFRELIDKMYNGEKIELFARKTSANWDVWGNQA